MLTRIIYIFCSLLLCLENRVSAQQVLYAPPVDERFLFQFDVVGEVGNNYWVERINRKRGAKRTSDPWGSDKQASFEIYDNRLQFVQTVVPPDLPIDASKVYLVPGNNYFDRLVLTRQANSTGIQLTRYKGNGELMEENQSLGSWPFAEDGNSFLLLRSEDKTKILLLAFESVPESAPRLHTMLFDDNWQLLSKYTYEHPFLSQPFIQYEFEELPLDNFCTSPLKLCDNGDWLMAASSRTNYNYLLFQFNGRDSAFVYSEINLPNASTLEDLALYIDNARREAQLGILSRMHYQTVKHATVARYSLSDKHFAFDTSYRFNTLAGAKIRNENLVQEYLIAIPQTGFMLLKEYGRDYYPDGQEGYFARNRPIEDDPLMNSIISNTTLPVNINPNDYTRYDRLGGLRNRFTRGDLSLFFFPASPTDSCWSGIINQAQKTELNSSYLSYLVIPVDGRLVILYNSYMRDDNSYANSTILDSRGSQLNGEGVVFWKMNNVFDFQKARQLAQNEVAVPYQRNGRMGFAIMRL